jgi:Lrp/AsnC family leucine-responsive transcriptional regulator
MQYMTDFDRDDAAILRILERDGRISNIDLAEKVGLSPSACLRRVQRLERTGVIRGYRAVRDPAALGVGLVAYLTVGLAEHTKKAQQQFENAIMHSSEVRECHNITGSVEYILRIEARDLEAYKAFHTDVLGTIPQVRSLTTYVVMSSPKDERS